jgi:hypothetical protein
MNEQASELRSHISMTTYEWFFKMLKFMNELWKRNITSVCAVCCYVIYVCVWACGWCDFLFFSSHEWEWIMKQIHNSQYCLRLPLLTFLWMNSFCSCSCSLYRERLEKGSKEREMRFMNDTTIKKLLIFNCFHNSNAISEWNLRLRWALHS